MDKMYQDFKCLSSKKLEYLHAINFTKRLCFGIVYLSLRLFVCVWDDSKCKKNLSKTSYSLTKRKRDLI